VGDYGGGVSAKRIRLENTRMLERALREQWPIPDEYREPIVKRQVKIAIDPDSSSREATSAARCIVSMQSQNNEIALKALDKISPDQHEHHGTIEHRHGLAELLAEQDYVGYLRNRTGNQDSDPRLVCQIREPGNGKPVENGEAHGGAGPGANGHRNGSE
jgi:hypothetical protein